MKIAFDSTQDRLRALYEITTRSEASIEEQFHSALKIGMDTLMTRVAIVSRIVPPNFTVLYCIAPPETIYEGDVFPLEQTYCDITVKENDVVAISDMLRSEYNAHPCHDRFKLESYIGVPLTVNGALFGTLNFSSPDPHAPEFSESDKDFVRLMGKWMSTTLERHAAETAVAQDRTTLKTLLENLPVGVMLAEAPSGKLLMVNKIGIELFGRNIDPSVQGDAAMQRYEIQHEDGSLYNFDELPLADTLKTGKPSIKSDVYIRHPDGTRINTRGSSAPIVDVAGKIYAAVVVFEDITREREIDRMKSEFISVASHQLRTPLTGIRWFTELMLGGKAGPISDQQKDFLQQIEASNVRMIDLVNDLLNVSRIETGKKFSIEKKRADMISIIEIVRADSTGMAQARNITLTMDDGFPKQLELDIDASKIQQVFQNLISNAIKYSKEGGTITFGCEFKPDAVTFSVRDTGVGIPAAQQSHMFEKFFRADNVKLLKTEGTGLGLYIVKAIIEGHDGKIWFESEENKGTTFFVMLPIKSVQIAE